MVIAHSAELAHMKHLSKVGTLNSSMINYLTHPSESSYLEMQNDAEALIAIFDTEISQKNIGGSRIGDSRILVTFADGHVAYDSSKSNNSHANAIAKVIAENHMNRISVMIAFMGKIGAAEEEKYSTSTNKVEEYSAERLGPNVENAIGCARFSLVAQSQFSRPTSLIKRIRL
jgi:hypothetical protein